MNDKIVVLSAPRSGTHMLVRMISRSINAPWAIPFPTDKIYKIKEKKWVIGVHDRYDNLLKHCPKNVKIICIKRLVGHEESLKRFLINVDYDVENVTNSFPPEFTVIYDEIIKSSKNELKKIESILNIKVEYEPWDQRYNGFDNWRKYKDYGLL